MSKFNSLAVKVPVILCIVTTILITIMLIISLTIAENGISKSRFEGFETTVMGYASDLMLGLEHNLIYLKLMHLFQ